MNTHAANSNLKFKSSFLLPKYWGTWLLLLLLRVLTIVPRSWVMGFGAWVGDLYLKYNQKRRHIVEVNLKLCFPDLSNIERKQLCIDHFRAYGRSLADMGLSLWGSEKKLRRLVKIKGLESHRDLVRENNVLVVTWHLTTLEVTGNILSFAGTSVSMMNQMKNPLLTWQIGRGRSRLTKVDLVMRSKGMRPLLRGLRDGKQCFLIPDEDFGSTTSDTAPNISFVPFFGTERALLATPSRLVKSTNAVVVTCATHLIPQTGKYICTISKPLKNVKGIDQQADAEEIAASMQQLIEPAPEQYIWTFRWFRSRRNGLSSPYDTV